MKLIWEINFTVLGKKGLVTLKAELSRLSAQTKLMPLRYKAELSRLSAQTKLMPLGINCGQTSGKHKFALV